MNIEGEERHRESEYDLVGEYGDWSDKNQSDCVSDFEETRDVIRNPHFDDDMILMLREEF